jgi:carboxyl-terminal processing protease
MATRRTNQSPATVWWKSLPAVIAAFLFVFGFGFFAGKYGIPPQQPATVSGGGGNVVDMTNFWETKKLIEEKYVHRPNSQDLITGAIRGLVQGLDDPYSDYLTKDEAAQLDQTLSGSVDGIGVEIGERDGLIQVIAPLPDSPASRAGIVAGDVITAVNGESTQGKSVDDVAQQIRGQKGTEVTVEVQTPGQPPRSLKLVRQTVKSPSVQVNYQGDVAVIKISRFGEDTGVDLDKLIPEITAKNPRGIVLDLRSNPGGYLDSAVAVASRFQKSGLVVKEQLRNGSEEESVDGNAPLADYPLVILVDQGSASAAEIAAGSLRDNRGVPLVGEKTYGKGSVQELEELTGGAILKLTIAEWLTPNGTSISKEGLKPDVTVPSKDPAAQLNAAIAKLAG